VLGLLLLSVLADPGCAQTPAQMRFLEEWEFPRYSPEGHDVVASLDVALARGRELRRGPSILWKDVLFLVLILAFFLPRKSIRRLFVRRTFRGRHGDADDTGTTPGNGDRK